MKANCFRDIRGLIFYALFKIKRQLLKDVNILTTLRCWAKGIDRGSGTNFIGGIIINRYPLSKITIGKNCLFLSSSYLNHRGLNHKCILQTGNSKAMINIGDECGFSAVSIVSDVSVTIGNSVTVGANTIIGDRDDHANIYSSAPKPIVIKDHVWIGMNCTILKGVKIGNNCVIGASSVVTKDVPDNCVAAGNPCRVIKAL